MDPRPSLGRSSPYCANMWRTYCCLTSFFLIVDTCLSCEDIARQSCAMVPRWRFLATFLRPVVSASRLHQVSDLHLKFALRHVSTIGKNLSSNISSTCSRNMVNFGRLAAEIGPVVWGTPANFNGFRVVAALLHGTPVLGISQTLRR